MNIEDSNSYIGGWGDIDGRHYNIEHSGVSESDATGIEKLELSSNVFDGITDENVSEVDYVQLHVMGPSVDQWVTIHGPWEDLDSMYDYLAGYIENDGNS